MEPPNHKRKVSVPEAEKGMGHQIFRTPSIAKKQEPVNTQ